MATANVAISQFVAKWRHAYQGCAKCPKVLAVLSERPTEGVRGGGRSGSPISGVDQDAWLAEDVWFERQMER